MLASETFFIEKIKYGLSLISESLTEDEEATLKTNMNDLSKLDSTPEEAQRLQEKCTKALSIAYQKNTENRKSGDWGLKHDATTYIKDWREYNSNIYHESELILSGVVQNWYLSEGRPLEKKAAGCLPVIITAAIVLILGIILNVL